MGIITAFGLSASAGLNAYIPLMVVAVVAQFYRLIVLNVQWDALTSWWVIGVLIVLSMVEFLADKIPAVNHINDAIQTIIRPAAGAILFAASTSDIKYVNPVLALVAGLLVAGGVHAVKSLALRPAVSVATGGVGNIPVSIAEDATSTLVSFLSIIIPVLVACFFILVTTIIVTRMIFRKKNQKSPNSYG